MLVILVTAAAARADTENGYISTGPTVGVGGEQDWLTAGAELDAGYRLNDTWLAHAHYGASWRVGDGAVNQGVDFVSPTRQLNDVRVGLLAEPCHGRSVCWFAGVDAGYRFGHFAGMTMPDVSGVIVTPQVGLDISTGSIHVRPAIEWTISYARSQTPEVPFIPDMALMLGVAAAYAW